MVGYNFFLAPPPLSTPLPTSSFLQQSLLAPSHFSHALAYQIKTLTVAKYSTPIDDVFIHGPVWNPDALSLVVSDFDTTQNKGARICCEPIACWIKYKKVILTKERKPKKEKVIP
jgi:hypothetical protein